MIALAALGLLGAGCSRSVQCDSPATVLAEAGSDSLTCHEASWAIAYAEVLAGRAMPTGDRRVVLRSVVDAFDQDPAQTRASLEQIRLAGEALSVGTGARAAERRAHAVYEAHRGAGPVPASMTGVIGAQNRTLAVWSSHEETELALTEADIEAWIRYASLCREIQSGGPLRVSVADRVTVYRMVQERFEAGTRAEKVAMSRMGAIWPALADVWRASSPETQQAFIAAAPLPPPMTATSLGYVAAVFDGDVVGHLDAVGRHLGPFTVTRRGPMFSSEVPPP